MPDSGRRLALMRAFAQSYRDRHFEDAHYDMGDGYLQTTLSDERRMPLRFFVDYNNAWWFEIVTAVDVPAVGYDPDSDSGFIVLDIRYDTETLRAMQHVHFSAHAVNRIRTYASGTFFASSHPLIELDRSEMVSGWSPATTCTIPPSRPASSSTRHVGRLSPRTRRPQRRSRGSGAT